MKQYISEKACFLHNFGLTDTSAIEKYLMENTANLTREKAEFKVERLAKDMLINYYNGDRTFVKRKNAN